MLLVEDDTDDAELVLVLPGELLPLLESVPRDHLAEVLENGHARLIQSVRAAANPLNGVAASARA